MNRQGAGGVPELRSAYSRGQAIHPLPVRDNRCLRLLSVLTAGRYACFATYQRRALLSAFAAYLRTLGLGHEPARRLPMLPMVRPPIADRLLKEHPQQETDERAPRHFLLVAQAFIERQPVINLMLPQQFLFIRRGSLNPGQPPIPSV